MKVLQVLNHFLPQQTAGTEVYTWALSRQLQAQGIETKIVIPHYKKATATEYVYDGLQVHQYAEPSVVDRSLILQLRPPDGLPFFKQYIEQEKPAVVHFHELAGSNGITAAHLRVAKEAGAKVLLTFHLAGYSCRTGNLLYKDELLCDGKINIQRCSACYLHQRTKGIAGAVLLRASLVAWQLGVDTAKWNSKAGTALGTAFLLQAHQKKLQEIVALCDEVVSLTDWYKKILLLNGVPASKISFIPQGLPFDPVAEAKHLPSATGPVKLLFLGRINPFKGLHLLLEALEKTGQQYFELDIYGNSDDLPYETRLKEQTKHRTNIRWKGKLMQQEVVKTMQHYDALCLCSTFSEMSPLVIQEAFAAGIPVIASNVYGNAEQVTHGVNGLLFRFKDADALKEQLLQFLLEPGLRKKLKQGVKPPRQFQTVAGEYIALYKKIVNS